MKSKSLTKHHTTNLKDSKGRENQSNELTELPITFHKIQQE